MRAIQSSGTWRWALGGAATAALALAAGELAAALMGGGSPIAAIGALVIDLQPPGAKDLMVALFGVYDKLALELATATGALLVGAALGVAARRDTRLAILGYVAFALVALFAIGRDPLVGLTGALLTVAAALVTAVLALPRLLPDDTPAVRPSDVGDSADRSIGTPLARRSFLVVTGTALAAGGVLAFIGRVITSRVPEVAAPRPVPRPGHPLSTPSPGADFAIDGLAPIVVPNNDFYRIDTRLTVPRLDAEQWSLRIHGLVQREVTLTYDDLLAMPMMERYVTIACVSNEVGGDLVGNAAWTGTPLRGLLERAGVGRGATQLVGRSFDGWTCGFPTAHLEGAGADAMVVVAMNGEILPPAHGFPARLIVPGLYGYVSATKWLTEIELTTWEGFDAYWVPLGWAKEAPILTQSRIDVPRSGGRLAAGPIEVAGVAWAPTRGISRVEVQLDDGAWQAAELSVPLADEAWVQWRVTLDIPTGAHTLRVRATDGTGVLQESRRTPPAPDGARGYHERRITVG